MARLVTYSLLALAPTIQRRHRVFLFIDEFQRMVARNLEYMLQLARSMGVGVILANQSMQDLKTAKNDLIPAIEANCRYRQWFSVSSSDDRRRLIDGSGETVELFGGRTETVGPQGPSTSESQQERCMSRLTVNDVLLASDHPKHSIVRIARGAGYAQYGGMPFIVESDYHITKRQYESRKSMPWPEESLGAFDPRDDDLLGGAPVLRPKSPKSPAGGVVVTSEVIGAGPEDGGDPFRSYSDALAQSGDSPEETK